MKLVIPLLLLLILPLFSLASGEEIAITITSGQLPVIDGTNSYNVEWKKSAEHMVEYPDGARLAFRSVHDRDNVYLLLDLITDTSIDNNRDFGVVCFDTKSDGGDRPKADDYCFLASQGSHTFITYQGGGNFGINNYLNKISNPQGVIAVGGISNEFDRYTDVPHTMYEFKIPTGLITRSNVYGVYYAVYDAPNGKVYSWPVNAVAYPYVPAPDQWGKLVSPDNSLPEFPSTSVAILAGALLLIALVMRTISHKAQVVKHYCK